MLALVIAVLIGAGLALYFKYLHVRGGGKKAEMSEWTYIIENDDDAVIMELPFIDLFNLTGLLTEMGANSQTTCPNVYDFVICSDHIYLELTNHRVFKFYANRLE